MRLAGDPSILPPSGRPRATRGDALRPDPPSRPVRSSTGPARGPALLTIGQRRADHLFMPLADARGVHRPHKAGEDARHEEDQIDVTITTPKRLAALSLAAAFAIGACSGSGASSAPIHRPDDRAEHRPPAFRARLDGAAVRLGHHRRLEHGLPDHRGRRRGVPEGEPRRQGHRRRSPAPAAGSRSSATARPT